LIKDNAHLLNLKEATITKASEIYKEIEDKGILKGKSVKGKVAGAIFFASRLVNQPKQIKQILSALEVNVKELNSCFKRIKELFPDERISITPTDIARQSCNRLGLAQDVNTAAVNVANNITNLEIATGRQP
jgi:transcription initiation factor TFIIIB Brf1 subunit/transcription initiation factor TFIIB